MLRWSIIRRSLILIMGVLAIMQFSPSVMAQEETATARKLDEFGGLFSSCDFGARLDNLAIELQNNPDTDGYVIVYGPEGKVSGAGVFRLEVTRDYLVNTRGLDPARVKTFYGGRYKELDEVYTELWVIPPGAAPPEPVSYESTVKTFSGMFAEYLHWDGPVEGDGIPLGNVTLAGFADVLREQSGARAYIVAQNTKHGAPGAWRRAANDVVAALKDRYEIQSERIKVICAGYFAEAQDEFAHAKLQLWILPQDAPPPVAAVTDPEPRPEKAVWWRQFGAYELEDAVDRRDVFDAFADVLRSDKDLSVCIIVHQQSVQQQTVDLNTGADQQEKDTGERTELHPDADFKLPDVDLMKLAAEWRSSLLKDFGISEQRLSIIAGGSEDWSYGMLEIWFVPPGAALPDPFEENSSEADEEGDAADAEGVDVARPEPY